MSSKWIYSLQVGLWLFVAAAPIPAQNSPASVSVDAKSAQHPISPYIYGFAFGATSDLTSTGFTMNREGGDLASTYNWQIDATNHANDWYFETFLDPTYDSDAFITQTRAANVGAQPLLTIPMLGYLGNLGPGNSSLRSFSIAKYGPQTGSDPYQPDAGNGISTAAGNPYITGNNPLDANVPNSVSIQKAWIQHVTGTWGTESAGGLKYYIMDNEPSLWSSTHRDVHPSPETYEEIYNDYIAYAGALRALDPNALIVGPEEWSWWAMFVSGDDQKNGIDAAGSDYNTHKQTYYYPWLLQQLYAYRQNTGNQLLNVLSVHYYPPELPNANDDSLSGQLTRNQSTRALWDPSYVDPSWFNQVGINEGIVNLIPTLKGFVSQNYPGLQTAVTEYNWGDEANLNGATTQADVLGIFGREGLDIATRWTVPANPSPTYLALEIYRNYDGKFSAFGDTSVSDVVANPDYLSSFAAVRTSDDALTVMVINKQQGTTPVTISLANFPTTGTAQAWQIASAAQTRITQLAGVPVTGNAITVTLPSQSITLFIIPPGAVTSKPTAPTGLAAAVGNGTATLTWNGGGGATSYSVGRSAVSGGPYKSLGSVADTSPSTYTDNGLTNGTTYYYVVSATNSAGSSPNSAQLAVTPILPPAFTSSAAASPNPVTQGTGTTIQATVTCTANTLTNGNIQILIVDPNGNTAATQSFTGQNFTPQQSQKYSMPLTPAIAGTYTVEVGVFSATWQEWNWNASAGSFKVNSSVVFASSVAAPSTFTGGAAGSITVTVIETGPVGLNNANVELQIFNTSGSAVATQVWSSQNFTAGQSRTNSYSWTPATSLPAGNYAVDVGVFDSAWTTNYYWNTEATIKLSGTKPLAFTSSAKAPSTLAAGGSAAIPVTVTETGPGTLANGNVELQIFNAGGSAVATQVWSSQNFASGQSLPYSYSWATPATLAPGTYTVDIGVFDSAWATDYYWNTDATIVVTARGSAKAQTIAFGPLSNRAMGAAPFALTATASSGLTVTFVSNSKPVCTVLGTEVTLVGAGTCSITASQAGDATWAAAPAVTRTLTVSGEAQTISFGTLGNRTVGAAPFALTATASSGLTVTFVSNSKPVCTVIGTEVTLVGAGTCSITASQAGNATWAAAPAVTRTFTVSGEAQTISFGTLGNRTMGAAPFALTATASSGLTVTFVSNSKPMCTVLGTEVTLVGAGTCSITASQAGDATWAAAPAVTRTFTVSGKAQTISFGTLGNRTMGAAPFALTATASSGLTVTFVSNSKPMCTVIGTEVTLVGAGTCSITASQAGDATWAAAPAVTRTFTVSGKAQTISFGTLGNRTMGAAPFALTATASSGLTVTFVSNSKPMCTVIGTEVTLVGAGTCSITASQAGDATWAAAPAVTRTFTVSGKAQTISFGTLGNRTMGAAPFALTATASSGLTVTFVSNSKPMCTVIGTEVTLVGAGTCSITASQAGNATWAAAPAVTRTFTVSGKP